MDIRLPLVEIFETVEGEGTRAGFPTIFVRLYGCNLRCTWCDTKYSYAPHEPEMTLSIAEIVERVQGFKARHICLTGGEPLLYGDRSAALIEALAGLDRIVDVHIETNGAIDLTPFIERISNPKVRYILDYKLKGSGENEKMVTKHFQLLRPQDEWKFVIGSEEDFTEAQAVLEQFPSKALPLFSPVWETMPPVKLVSLMLMNGLAHVKLNMQIHKIIWDPELRGV